jgi:hypothetical protein
VVGSFERIADRKIREAMEQGVFDSLPNQGQPLDLEDYFKVPPELRLAYSVLKSAGCLPEQVELLNAIAGLERQIQEAPDETQRAALRKTLAARRVQLDVSLERLRRR